MREITDPELLAQLEGKEVTDPGLLAQLEGKAPVPAKESSFLEKTISNIPPSAVEYGKAIVGPILHPVDTFTSLTNAMRGIDVKLRKLTGQKSTPQEQEYERYADAIGDYVKDRYGGWESIKKTVSDDPVGFMGDLSTFLTGAGGIASKIGPISKAGQVASKVGQLAEPLSAAMKTASLPAKIMPGQVTSKLYQSAAKFSTTYTPAKRASLTRTALQHEIKISTDALDKLSGKINDLNSQIENRISLATQTGSKIQTQDLFKHFQELYDEAKLSGRPSENIKAIDKIKDGIEGIHKTEFPGGLTPEQAQKLKQKVYKDLENYYSKVTESPVSVKAQKMVALAAKEELEAIIPEIKLLNKQEGALIELKDALERASNRITNRDILGIGLPIKVGAGGIPGGVKGAAVGLMMGILDAPKVKSSIAVVLQRLKTKGIKVRPTSTAIRLGLFQMGKGKESVSGEGVSSDEED